MLDGFRLICSLEIRCRWAPSPALQNLAKQLLDRQAHFHYGQQESILCVNPVSYDVEKNEPIPFSRHINVTALSRDDLIDVKLEVPTGRDNTIEMLSISNCPYKLKSLIHDQGLNCCFGRRDHRSTHF